MNLIYQRFRHFRNKIKSVDRAFLDFPCPQAWWSLNKPSGCAFGLANDSTKPFGHGKSKKARLSRLYSYNSAKEGRMSDTENQEPAQQVGQQPQPQMQPQIPPQPPPLANPGPSIAITPPKALSDTGELAEEWKIFKTMYENYSILVQLERQSKQYRLATFMYTIGPRGVQLISSLHFEDNEDKENVTLIVKKLEEVIIRQTNVIYERYVFNNRSQKPEETVDQYVSDLVKQAKNCDFCECMRKQLIRDCLVVGVKDASVRKLLLQKRDLTLEKAVDICRGAEATAAQLQKMNTENDVNKVKYHDRKKRLKMLTEKHEDRRERKYTKECRYCGKLHSFDNKKNCPAWGRKCSLCKRYNHYATKCLKKVNQIEDDDELSDYYEQEEELEAESLAIEATEVVNSVNKNNTKEKKRCIVRDDNER